MTNKYTVEFGRPGEKERFVDIHERFFERLPNLQKAIDVAFLKENGSLVNTISFVVCLLLLYSV